MAPKRVCILAALSFGGLLIPPANATLGPPYVPADPAGRIGPRRWLSQWFETWRPGKGRPWHVGDFETWFGAHGFPFGASHGQQGSTAENGAGDKPSDPSSDESPSLSNSIFDSDPPGMGEDEDSSPPNEPVAAHSSSEEDEPFDPPGLYDPFEPQDTDRTPNPVPAPGALGLGAVGLALIQRWRRKT